MTEPAPAPARPARPRWVILIAPIVIIAAVIASGGLPIGRPAPASPGPSTTAPASGPADSSTNGSAATPTDAPTAGVPTPVPSPTPSPPSPRPAGDFLLMSRADLMARPTSGPAWEAMLAMADAGFDRPRLRDQDGRHGLSVLAAALVHARTGDGGYRDKARDAIMDAIGTERKGADNSILALGRQLGAYVLAADFIDLDGADDEEFRAWLDEIRTRELGGHGRWTSLVGTHRDSANNWGAFAGASRIAASLYLGDDEDVAEAAQVLRGFLGDRAGWDGFQPVDESAPWACRPNAFVPINSSCVRSGIDLDGAIVRDISRGGGLEWPPGDTGVGYTLEALQGLILQAELLTVNGWGDAWSWSDEALRRAADVVTRSGASGGSTWNRSEVSYHVPWLLNARYGLDLPTQPAGQGRVFGYTDWLYGD